MLDLFEDKDHIPIQLLHRLTPAQYEAMIHAEIIDPEEKIELLQGLVTKKMSKNPAHWVYVHLLYQLLSHMLATAGSDRLLRMEAPIVAESSVPEPDISLIRGQLQDFLERQPRSEEVELIIEVADSSLVRDRSIKKGIYAQAGVPIYWIVNLQDQLIEVYTQPLASGDYGTRQTYPFSEAVSVFVDGKAIGELQLSKHLQ